MTEECSSQRNSSFLLLHDTSFNVIKNIIDGFELGLHPRNTVICEPQLGKRKLYTSQISQKGIYKEEMCIRKNLLNSNNRHMNWKKNSRTH